MAAFMFSKCHSTGAASASSCAHFVVDIMDTVVILAVSIIMLRIRLCGLT